MHYDRRYDGHGVLDRRPDRLGREVIRLPFRSRLPVCTGLLVVFAGCTTTPLVDPDPDWMPPASASVLIVPPDSRMVLLSVGGMPEERADWSSQARANLRDALANTFGIRGVSVVSYPVHGDVVPWRPEDAPLVKLHEAVGGAILASFILPTQRERRPYLDYGLGGAVRRLHDDFGADFALFVRCNAAYASGGRVALGVLAAIGGVGIDMGTLTGFASLVDLRDGRVVWFRELVPRGTALAIADPRDPEGATVLADLLLEDVPL